MKFMLPIVSILLLWVFGVGSSQSRIHTLGHNRFKVQEDPKDIAFTVLRNKCNVCHATKKRTDIFTLDNMDSLAIDIHKQVFVKKKMPKGRKVILTTEEQQILEQWLSMVIKDPNSSQSPKK